MINLKLLRRFSQAFFLLLFIYILWSTTYPLKGFLPPGTFFKFDPLVMIITSISQRILVPGIIFSILMILASLVIGRFFCSWVCPLGTTFDCASRILRGTAAKKESWRNEAQRKIKYMILSVVLLFSFFGIQLAWFFDPMVIMARFVSLNLIPAATLTLNSFFIMLIKGLGMTGPVHDLYRALRSSALGINTYFFSHSAAIFIFFLIIVSLVLYRRRAWCRFLCPLGAIYALASRFALLRRTLIKCAHCRPCKSDCRMGAIREDQSYLKEECILCMDCRYDCAANVTRFRFPESGRKSAPKEAGGAACRNSISRKDFLLSFLALPLAAAVSKKRSSVIRPPAALREDKFVNACVRCGNCMKVCPTNGLQPALFQSGIEGIWTPHLVPEIGYCEYNCTLCGNTCPTGALKQIASVEEKHRTRLGVAEVDRSICIPWAEDKECIVCEEHCPVFEKAIKLTKYTVGDKTISRPYVDMELCVGCGICQNKCPVRPMRAVRVRPDISFSSQFSVEK